MSTRAGDPYRGMSRNTRDQIKRMSEPLPRHVVESCAKIGLSDVRDHFQKSMGPSGPWPPVQSRPHRKTAGKPLLDTGLMRAGLTTRVVGSSYYIGSTAIQAGTHNFGAVITPKNGKFLAIPLTKEAYYVGSPRKFPRPLDVYINREGSGGVMFEWPIRIRRGKVEDLDPIDHYWLTKKVTIPKREFLWISDDANEKIQRRVQRYYETGK